MSILDVRSVLLEFLPGAGLGPPDGVAPQPRFSDWPELRRMEGNLMKPLLRRHEPLDERPPLLLELPGDLSLDARRRCVLG